VTLPLVIVGAGIAGLATALALRRHGIDAVVVERRLALPNEGAGVQIGPNGAHVLRRLGVLDAVAARGVSLDHIAVTIAGHAAPVARLPLGSWMQARHGAPYISTLRTHLIQVLYDAALRAGADVRFGVSVDRVRASGGHVDITFGNGKIEPCDGVIGADGVWSQVRSQVFDTSAPSPTGRVAVRALIDHASDRDGAARAVSVTMAADAHLVVYPVTAATTNVVLIARGDQSAMRWSEPIDAAVVARRLTAFGASGPALCSHGSTWRQWPLVQAPRLMTYMHGRVALIGDAAHAMVPFLAQGAVMALEDAEALALCLLQHRDVADAFARYSGLRLRRTQRVVATAEQNGRIYHLTGPMALARNAFLGSMPGPLLMRRYDWLYGGASEVPI
jgi:salicylate hydroxylase